MPRRATVLRLYAGASTADVHVKAIVDYDGAGTDGSAVLMPLSAAQQFLHEPGRIKYVLVSNRGGSTSGVAATDQVVRMLRPAIAPLGLQANPTKQDALETADAMGAAFVSMFTTFGSFSIAAGILLIFLIFVMLAAERRAELGIARAVGTRQRTPRADVPLRGRRLRPARRCGRGRASGSGSRTAWCWSWRAPSPGRAPSTSPTRSRPRTIVVAYAIGVLLTFVVVAFSAWRVSRMNIVTAIRNLPEPPAERGTRRRWLLGGARHRLRPASHRLGRERRERDHARVRRLAAPPRPRAGGRAARACPNVPPTPAPALALVIWFVLPISRWLFGDLKVNFSIFILSGLMIVIGATWTIMYNADVLRRRGRRGRWVGSGRSHRCFGCRWPIRCETGSAPA